MNTSQLSRPDLSIVYGQPTGQMLNPNLVAKMGLDAKRVDALKASHVGRLRLFEEMEMAPVQSLLRLAKQFDDLEFHQQGMWGFPLDRDHHLWWSVPRCSCPNHMNRNLVGMPLRVVALDCKVHGRLVCDEPKSCLLCPTRLPVDEADGNIVSWEDIPASLCVVNVDCPEHGTPLVNFQPIRL